jgi:membrane protein
VQEQARVFLDQYFQGTRAFQGVSLVVMLGGVIGLLSTIEEAFNHIWGIKRGRSLSQRLTTYTTIAVLGPFLVGLSLTMTVSLQNTELLSRLQGWAPVGGLVGFFYGLLPLLINILGLTALYLIMPNTRVRFRSAFPSAVVAGIVWEAIKWGYGLYLSSATMYRTLYGPLVAIPLLFLWIQASWMIVLFGALLTFAQEAADDFRLEEVAVTASFRERLRAALHCMVSICQAHFRGEGAPRVSELSAKLHIPVRLVRASVGDLLGGGLLHEVVRQHDRGEGGLVPARDLHNLSIYDVLSCVQDAGTATPRSHPSPETREVEEALGQIDATLERLGRPMTLAHVIEALERRAGAPVELLRDR